MNEHEDMNARFERLARGTAAIRASRGLSSRVLARVENSGASGPWGWLVPSARRWLPVALACAVAAIAWALVSDRAASRALASSYAEMELDF